MTVVAAIPKPNQPGQPDASAKIAFSQAEELELECINSRNLTPDRGVAAACLISTRLQKNASQVTCYGG